MKGARQRLTYANVMVTVLAFVVLGGSAYAALHLQKNSVTTKQIRNGTIKSVDVKRNTLGGRQVNEAKLGRVRAARTAVTAGSAASAEVATSARSVKRIYFSQATPDPGRQFTTLADLGNGESLEAKCFFSSPGVVTSVGLRWLAPDGSADGEYVIAGPSSDPFDGDSRANEVPVSRGTATTPSHPFALLPNNYEQAASATDADAVHVNGTGGFETASGVMTWSDASRTVSLQFSAFAFGGGPCSIRGTLEVGS